MKKRSLIILSLAVLALSCKKINVKKLTIGDEKKMIVTEENINLNTSFTSFSSINTILNHKLDLDHDSNADIMITLTIKDENWVKNEGDPLPWTVNLTLLNPNFFIREVKGSNKVYSKLESSFGTNAEGMSLENHSFYTSCTKQEGYKSSRSASYILAGDPALKFGSEANGNWSNDPNSLGFIVAQSPEKSIEYLEIEEGASLIIQKLTRIERNCHQTDLTKPVYIQFKTAATDYKLGWIELVFDTNSFTIKRHAISKKIIRE